jgi:hypothetical protein
MVRRVTPSQFRSMVRQAEQKRGQASDKLKRDLRTFEQKVKQAVDQENREIRARHQRAKQAVDTYNRGARAHNARVRADRQRLRNEIARLGRQSTTTHYASFRVSVTTVQTAYQRLESVAESGRLDERFNEVLDLTEREAANSAGLMNALLGGAADAAAEIIPNATESPLTPFLSSISADLAGRWRGALYALSPQNPDAARHFCTSAREVIATILTLKAPDDAVAAALPDCERTPERGTPTRRAKIRYFLHRKGMASPDLESFVEADMDNVVELFGVFNQGTHGSAGTFDLPQLQAIRRRVEDALTFLAGLVT